jgi:hypothetical protein
MEQTDWIHQGFDPAQAQFLMVTAITHHRFSSPIWGEHEVRKLYAELAEIAASVSQAEAPRSSRWRITWPSIRRASARRSRGARSARRPRLNEWLGLR